MQRPYQPHSLVNLFELKAQLVKRLGPDRSKLYFYYLNKLLSLKLSKGEFCKFCLRFIGRENIKLHNQLIRSILKNACSAKVPPSASTQDEDSFEFTSNNANSENGDFDSHEKKKLVQHHQVIPNKTHNEGEVGLCHLAKIKGTAESVISVCTDEQHEPLVVGDAKELSTRSPLKAPIGKALCPFSVGGAHQTPFMSSSDRGFSSYNSGELLDTVTLKEHMQQIAASHGIEGVSMDCAKLLNSGLNAYLKRLIRSSIELGRTRCGSELLGNNIHKRRSHGGLVNGPSINCPLAEMPEQRWNFPISLLDFKVAMWLKPQQLGEDCLLLLEKIYTYSYEE